MVQIACLLLKKFEADVHVPAQIACAAMVCHLACSRRQLSAPIPGMLGLARDQVLIRQGHPLLGKHQAPS